MTESPEYAEVPEPDEDIPPGEEPEDFEPEDDWDDEHSKEEVGGPGGVENNPDQEYGVFVVEEEENG